jgi:putative addiction module component (TIGR02574 family)
MDVLATIKEITSLSVEDRLKFVEAIWESIAAEPEGLPLTEAQKRELERRIAAHSASPDEAIPWEVVRAEALARARK